MNKEFARKNLELWDWAARGWNNNRREKIKIPQSVDSNGISVSMPGAAPLANPSQLTRWHNFHLRLKPSGASLEVTSVEGSSHKKMSKNYHFFILFSIFVVVARTLPLGEDEPINYEDKYEAEGSNVSHGFEYKCGDCASVAVELTSTSTSPGVGVNVVRQEQRYHQKCTPKFVRGKLVCSRPKSNWLLEHTWPSTIPKLQKAVVKLFLFFYWNVKGFSLFLV